MELTFSFSLWLTLLGLPKTHTQTHAAQFYKSNFDKVLDFAAFEISIIKKNVTMENIKKSYKASVKRNIDPSLSLVARKVTVNEGHYKGKKETWLYQNGEVIATIYAYDEQPRIGSKKIRINRMDYAVSWVK